MKYIYEVTSDVPLALITSFGNIATVMPHAMHHEALEVRDVVKSKSCGPQCAPATITLELKEKST